VEFMAALMTSVIDNPGKCAEYIVHCREMKIRVLPPSINSSEGPFTTEDGCIRYGLYAIKSIGRGVIDRMVEEREKFGSFESLRDFISRTYGKDMNKRAIENLIKAGATDCLEGTRKQHMQIYSRLLDQAASESKERIEGQMSLMDFLAPEQRKVFEVRMPNVGEFAKEELLADEKEVMGVYLSGHPLEDYTGLLKARTTALSTDFAPDEETGEPKVVNGSRAVVGGMVIGRTIKYTRNNKVMCFLTVEDLVGSVEVLVFPNVYERFKAKTEEESKILVEGRVSAEEDKASKLIAEEITLFGEVPQELWLAFPTMDDWNEKAAEVRELLRGPAGRDQVFIFIREKRAYKREGSRGIMVTPELMDAMRRICGEDSVTLRTAGRRG